MLPQFPMVGRGRRKSKTANGAYGFIWFQTPSALFIFSPVTNSVQQFGLREASLNTIQNFARTYPIVQRSEAKVFH